MNVNASYLKKPTHTESGVVGICIKPPAVAAGSRPIHMALVLDESGSMEGDRIESVKKTLTVLVQRLSVGDKISVVSFATDAKCVLKGLVIDESTRATAIDAAATLAAGGGTNMEAGISMLGSFLADTGRPDAVVILTDGHVNHGLQTAAGLNSVMQAYASGVPVYTLGYGADHNGGLLRSLASRSNGTYTFIGTEIVLPAAIGDLFGSLQNEVAKQAAICYPATWTCEEPEQQVAGRFTVGSLVAEKSTWVMLGVPAGDTATAVELVYTVDGVENRVAVVVEDGGLPLLDMEVQMLRCATAKTLDAVVAALTSRNNALAKQLLEAALALFASSPAAACPLAIHMKAQLDEMKETVDQAPSPALLLHTTSVAANYTSQRGVSMGGGGGGGAPLSRAPTNPFGSPGMARATTDMTAQYSQGGGDPHVVC